MFPKISNINDILPAIEGNTQIRVKPDDLTGHTVICYMLQDEDTFSGASLEFERECRGITFDKTGNIVARTMHKFFNIGEREELLPQNIDWSSVTRIMEKRDGSMVTPVLLDGSALHFKFKTKKSFSTKEAALADELAAHPGKKQWVLDILALGLTPTFEITSPKMPIVVLYKQDELTLLHIRENVTGRYFTEAEILALLPPFNLVQKQNERFTDDKTGKISWDKLKVYAEMEQGVEGVVIQFSSGDMVKLKTAWYIKLHHSVTFTRWRDIARTVCADQADDLKAAFTMVGRSVDPILQIERSIKAKITEAQDAVHGHVQAAQVLNSTPKDLALSLKDNPLFGQIMNVFRNKEVNWMEWYEKNHIHDWSLEVVDI
jgi:T4 RnlA family RNA ligase